MIGHRGARRVWVGASSLVRIREQKRRNAWSYDHQLAIESARVTLGAPTS